MQSQSNFAQPIEKNLKHHGFEVTYIDCSPKPQHRIKLSVSDYLYDLYRKVFYADFSYKEKTKQMLKKNGFIIESNNKYRTNISTTLWSFVQTYFLIKF